MTDKDKWKQFAEEQTENEGEAPELNEAAATDPVEAKLAELEQTVAKYKDQIIRSQAELQNIQRRAERDVQNAYKYSNEKLINELLPVVDSLDRGLANGAQDDPMRAGLQLTLDLLLKTLEKQGVQVLDPKPGDAFNPEQHEAMAMQPDPKAKSNTILHVAQRGFMLNGRVLRAAMVVVAA